MTGFGIPNEMELMGMLSEEEKTFISAVFGYCNESYSLSSSTNAKVIAGRKDFPVLADFLDKVIIQNRYMDRHCGNIMMDCEENYRIIDIEGFMYGEFNSPCHSWITRE